MLGPSAGDLGPHAMKLPAELVFRALVVGLPVRVLDHAVGLHDTPP